MTDSTDSEQTDLRTLRRQFESYSSAKANEIDEQRLSWRYYHIAQWSAKQLKVLKDRHQPEITFDNIGRKIDGLIGTVRRLRTDPKAYPRTEKQEQGADVATQVIRTICDQSQFEDLEAECARDAAVHGIGVSQLTFTKGDHGDPDFTDEYVDPRTFFYDPRSVKPDFSDARYMGVYKWAGLDEIDEIVPGAADKVEGSSDSGTFTAFDTDRELLWVDEKDRYRLVDHWWISGGKWKWCLHVGGTTIQEGESPFYDRLGRSQRKFFAFANQIDHDGDHYGYVRRLKGPQDAINQHRSKAMHIMNTRQLIIRKGVVASIEVARREIMRPDGVLEHNGQTADDFRIEQPAQEFLQQTQYYEDAKGEIEKFGPNQALLGDLGQSASGRAYAMAQQAGLAELGPFLKNYRMWKLEQYQAMWCAAQRYWTAERFLRVTDDQGLAQFMPVNQVDKDEYGQPALVNSLGAIDVDIVIDEGPDTETIMGDVNDTLQSLAQNGVAIPPMVFIETSKLDGETKKKIAGLLSQPDPMKQIAQADGAAKVDETKSKTALNLAKAHQAVQPEQPQPGQPQEFQLPPEVQLSQAVADIAETHASAFAKQAQGEKAQADARMAPFKFVHEVTASHADRELAAEQAKQQAKRQSQPA